MSSSPDRPFARRSSALALAARVVLDVLWGVAVAGVSLGQLATGVILAGLGLRAAAGLRLGRLGRLGWLALAWALWVGATALRAPGSVWSWGFAAHYVGPLVILAAVAVERPNPADLVRPALVCVLGVLGWGAVRAVAGDGVLVLHGWPRLVGGHGNVHTLAATLAVAVPVAATLGATATSRGDRRLGGAAAAIGGIALVLTFVRTAWIWALVAGAVALVVQRRPRAALGVAGGGAALAVLSGRFGSLLLAATGQAPSGGWSKLGSSRVEIWQHVVGDWLSADPATWLLGAGLGAHLGAHRHLEPHSEVLALVLQLGLVGLVLGGLVWGAVGIGLLRAARQSREPWVALALGLWVGATLTAPISNDLVTRTTASWWSWALWGAAWAASRPAGPPRPPAG